MEDGDNNEIFQGFSYPDDSGFTRFPHDWMDIIAQVDNISELKVLFYLARHTWGFQEYDQWKHITMDEFANGRCHRDGTRMDNGTGLSESSARHGLHKATKHGYILCAYDTRDKARTKLFYKLKMCKSDQ